MALYTTEAIVLGAKNWGEADKIMTFFTRERGLVRATAFGCRRPRSQLAGAMQLFSELEVQLAEGQPEPEMYARLQAILAAFETRNPRVTALAAVYQLLEYTGLELHYERCVHCAAELQGDAFFAINEGGALCPHCRTAQAVPYPASVRELIVALRDLDWGSAAQLRIHGHDLVAAESIMLAYLPTIIGHPLRSLAFIQQVTA